MQQSLKFLARAIAIVFPLLGLSCQAQVLTEEQTRQLQPEPTLSANTNAPIPSTAALHQKARQITVRVYSGRMWGTGVIIDHQGGIYTVVTNDHVLLPGGGQNYRIQTYDNRIHAAEIVNSISWFHNDLGIVQFRSVDNSYNVAAIAPTPVALGETVIAAGFPLEPEPSAPQGFVITQGQVSRWMPQPFIGGYQIGYTNDIFSGMSGGPLLNRRGELVAINGMHKYPLWGNAYQFVDGSSPDPTEAAKLVEYSWAVPIHTVLQLAPNFTSANTINPKPSPPVEPVSPVSSPSQWFW
ncbi:MAG: trypsin-like peptidase domain-containing protein [Arthrospira sp. SH-MAG29]|nr:serine protease [Arthrospira sp. SH-MAG29]MBS0018066.1 trypsin-like peptidase domain-containing protein [Arthrospira sp. SH-MAG29]